MSKLSELFESTYSEECNSLTEWCDAIYEKFFHNYYALMDDVKSKVVVDRSGAVYAKISDTDLEAIITELPIQLYSASESLNKLRLECEMVKLKFKQLRRKSEVCDSDVEEHQLLIKAYESVIARAENERSSCKELIMGAKKIWDARRSAERSNPIGEVNVDDLPGYSAKSSQYIHG